MPQSLAAVYLHIIFSTKNREPWLREKSTRDALHEYLGGVAKKVDCAPIRVGGFTDHVHVLVRFARTITIANLVKELKTVSNSWIKEKNPSLANFEWQAGYGAFSVSSSKLDDVVAYIANQEEHHKTVTFQDELRAFFTKHKIEFDEKYVWD